jgi:hypothetical protein
MTPTPEELQQWRDAAAEARQNRDRAAGTLAELKKQCQEKTGVRPVPADIAAALKKARAEKAKYDALYEAELKRLENEFGGQT